MDEIMQLTQTNWVTFVVTFFIILFSIKEIIEIFTYFKKKFNIKTGIQTDKENLETRITTLEEHDKWQYGEISKILEGIEDIRTHVQEFEISSHRWEILDFASSLASGKKFSKERFDHIMSIHTQYEKIIVEAGKTNGLIDSSMEVIQEKYKECLKNGFE